MKPMAKVIVWHDNDEWFVSVRSDTTGQQVTMASFDTWQQAKAYAGYTKLPFQNLMGQ